MNKLEQFLEKIQITNPEFKFKTNPTEDYAILFDKFGNRALVTTKYGWLVFTGVGKTKSYRKHFENYRQVINEKDSSLIYKQIQLFDSGRRYDHSKQEVPFGQRFYSIDKIEKFIDDVDDSAYIKELDESIAEKLIFCRWKLDRDNPTHREKFEILKGKRISVDGMNIINDKHSLLFLWYFLGLKLSYDFNLVDELECLYKQVDKDKAEQLRVLTKDWKLDEEL